jgi:glycosyltransferase involved in cell wall biosynthesis
MRIPGGYRSIACCGGDRIGCAELLLFESSTSWGASSHGTSHFPTDRSSRGSDKLPQAGWRLEARSPSTRHGCAIAACAPEQRQHAAQPQVGAMTEFSIIIPWRQRPELARTLAENAACFERHGAEVIIVNCGPADDVEPLIRNISVSGLRHVVVPMPAFNKCLAHNLGVMSSTGRYLFLLDADIILCSDVIAQSRAILARGRQCVNIRHVRESEPVHRGGLPGVKEMIETRDMTFIDGKKAQLRLFKRPDGSRAISGELLVSRSHFIGVGGFNSELQGWGHEDLDLMIRLQAAGGLSVRHVGTVMHLTHGDEKRNIKSGSRLENNDSNRQVCFENYARGLYLGTYARDVEAWQHLVRDEPRAMRVD